MRWFYLAASGTPDKALDLVYCQQDLSVLNRDIIGNPPYNLASELVYCQQDLSVLNRTP
jgi:hypothetical protein